MCHEVGRAWWAVETWVKQERRKLAIGIVWSFPRTNQSLDSASARSRKTFSTPKLQLPKQRPWVLGCLGDRHGSIMMNLSKQTKTYILSCSSSESFSERDEQTIRLNGMGLVLLNPQEVLPSPSSTEQQEDEPLLREPHVGSTVTASLVFSNLSTADVEHSVQHDLTDLNWIYVLHSLEFLCSYGDTRLFTSLRDGNRPHRIVGLTHLRDRS